MINYIKNDFDGGMTYPNKELIERSALGVIKKLCMRNLFTLEGYLKATKKTFNLGYKVPIYINDHHIFIYTKALKDYDNIFINYTEIKEVKSNKFGIEITFNNLEKIEVKLSIKNYKRLVMTIFSLYKYKESLV
ncbi:competence protein ComK [Acholeplasma hippikon]|nr:competence protein ComK [Acholeplasma hippikon]